jgi:hypothetical protein
MIGPGGRICPEGSRQGMITINPELPYEQGPKLLSIILPICEMILEERGDITRIEKSLFFYSIMRK